MEHTLFVGTKTKTKLFIHNCTWTSQRNWMNIIQCANNRANKHDHKMEENPQLCPYILVLSKLNYICICFIMFLNGFASDSVDLGNCVFSFSLDGFLRHFEISYRFVILSFHLHIKCYFVKLVKIDSIT